MQILALAGIKIVNVIILSKIIDILNIVLRCCHCWRDQD